MAHADRTTSDGDLGAEVLVTAAVTLLDLEMPPDQVWTVLAADRPDLVRRHLELHGEMLRERLADRLQALAQLEEVLCRAVARRGDPRGVRRTA